MGTVLNELLAGEQLARRSALLQYILQSCCCFLAKLFAMTQKVSTAKNTQVEDVPGRVFESIILFLDALDLPAATRRRRGHLPPRRGRGQGG